MRKNNLDKIGKNKRRKINAQTDYFLNKGINYIDYKDTANLRKFINRQGRINAHKQNKLISKSQRQLSVAIKRSRQMGLLPHIIVEQNEEN